MRQLQTGTPTNNSTVQHRNPDTVDESGNLTGTQSWLGNQLAQRLEGSSIQLSQGQYEQADGLVGEEFQSLLGQYVDVDGETNEQTDDQSPETIRETADTQRDFVNETRRFNRLYQNYTQARERGNEQRARRIARNLSRLEQTISTTQQNLTRNYGRVGGITNTNFSQANQSVAQTVTNVTTRQQAVRNASFFTTQLRVQATSPQFSFTDPIQLRGRLVTDNGTAVTNRTITLTVGTRRTQVETTRNGSFTVTYRPVLFPTSRDRLIVEYRPRTTAPYLGSRTSVPATVTATTPNVTVDINRDRLQYRDQFTVQGRVTAANTSVPRLPIAVQLGPSWVGVARTGPDGQFSLTGSLPATVTSGAHPVTASVAVEGRAISSASATARVTIDEQPTELTLATSRDDTISATGTLTTPAGTPIPNQAIALYIDGQRVETVRTNADGRYAASIDPANSTDEDGPLVARLDTDGTNLAPANATAQLPPATTAGGPSDLLIVLTVAGLAGLVAALGGGLWLRRRDPTDQASATATSSDETVDDPQPTDTRATELLTQAQSHLDAGDVRPAIELAYAAVRAEFDAHGTAATHWEFYSAIEADLSDADRDHLRDLTQWYEATVYADTTDEQDSEHAVQAAKALLD